MAFARLMPFLGAALGALLLWAAFPPMGETGAITFALAPLLAVSRLCSPRRAAAAWALGGFLFWFGTLSWMPAIVKNNGPWPLVLLGWIGLALMCTAYGTVFGWLIARYWRRAKGDGARLAGIIFLEPVLWAGLEWLRSWLVLGGFAWNDLGTAVGTVPSLAAPARIGGVYLVSALVVLLNGVFATLICRVVAQMRRTEGEGCRETQTICRCLRLCETAVPLGLILLAFWGARGLTCAPAAVRPLRVALVQRNAPCIFSRRDRQVDPREVFDQMLDQAVLLRPELIVWAESAMAEFGPLASEAARETARHFCEKADGASLLAGGDWWQTIEVDGVRERRAWNAAGLYTVNGTNVELQVYGKQHLVPFGEYIPLDKWIKPLQKLSPIGISLWPGEAALVDLKGLKLAPLVCFEDTDPVLARRAARLGAQALVLITNDSWFSHSVEPRQHAEQAVLRAIETGLPVIRVGNSGVTGVISSSGRTRWLQDRSGRPLVDAEGTMVETVYLPADPVQTPYVRWGDGPLIALFLLALAVAAVHRSPC